MYNESSLDIHILLDFYCVITDKHRMSCKRLFQCGRAFTVMVSSEIFHQNTANDPDKH